MPKQSEIDMVGFKSNRELETERIKRKSLFETIEVKKRGDIMTTEPHEKKQLRFSRTKPTTPF